MTLPNDMRQYEVVDGVTYEYDSNGNLTFDGERRFYYDYKNRLREVYVDNVLRARYSYDGKDRRVSKTVYEGDGTVVKEKTLFIYDGWQVIEEQDASGTLVAEYVYGRGIDELAMRMQKGARLRAQKGAT